MVTPQSRGEAVSTAGRAPLQVEHLGSDGGITASKPLTSRTQPGAHGLLPSSTPIHLPVSSTVQLLSTASHSALGQASENDCPTSLSPHLQGPEISPWRLATHGPCSLARATSTITAGRSRSGGGPADSTARAVLNSCGKVRSLSRHSDCSLRSTGLHARCPVLSLADSLGPPHSLSECPAQIPAPPPL